jgi:mediator of RNA polymerase II transcription subunit 6
MANKLQLLDEQDFNQPACLIDLKDQDINKAHNFSWYFYSSQFNEPQSNNTAVLNVHKFDPPTYYVIHDRKEFESRVLGIPTGLQFIVAGEPQGEGQGQPWLMQRQNRIANEPERRVDTYVEGNWYNVGTRILMAPSLLDVVRARLVRGRHEDAQCLFLGKGELTASAAYRVDAYAEHCRNGPEDGPLQSCHWALVLSRDI